MRHSYLIPFGIIQTLMAIFTEGTFLRSTATLRKVVHRVTDKVALHGELWGFCWSVSSLFLKFHSSQDKNAYWISTHHDSKGKNSQQTL